MVLVKKFLRPTLMVLFALSLLFIQKVTFSDQSVYKTFFYKLGMSLPNITVALPIMATLCLLLLFVLPDEEAKSAETINNQ